MTEVILIFRGKRVLMDSDLAKLYGVSLEKFNMIINSHDSEIKNMMFKLNDKEVRELKLLRKNYVGDHCAFTAESMSMMAGFFSDVKVDSGIDIAMEDYFHWAMNSQVSEKKSLFSQVKKLLPFMLILLSFGVHAQVDTSTLEVPSRTSRENRADKEWQLLGGYGFITHNSAKGALISVGRYINEKSLIELNGSFYRGDKSALFADQGTKYDVIALNYQKFNGNSVYVSLGLFYSQIKDQLSTGNRYSFFSSTPTNVSVESYRKDLGARISVGNQWQWDHFTLRCDWVGYQQTFKNLSRGGYDFKYYSVDDEGNTKLHTRNTFGDLTFLKISAGLSF